MSGQAFEVEWKGKTLGKLTIGELRSRLAAGQLSRLHRVRVNGVWQSLGEWLDQIDTRQRENVVIAQQQAKANTEQELNAERARAAALEARLADLERQAREPQPAAPAWNPAAPRPEQLPHNPFAGQGGYHPAQVPEVCGLAVAALVFGIVAVVLFGATIAFAYHMKVRWVNLTFWSSLLAWLLTTIFGHIALGEIRRSPGLGGRAMAITGLALGYAVIAFLVFLLILAATDNDYRNRFNF
jgi:BMFP domain-containing protein YqiC/succinate dehydrogenase hydrophobic anchor subunit